MTERFGLIRVLNRRLYMRQIRKRLRRSSTSGFLRLSGPYGAGFRKVYLLLFIDGQLSELRNKKWLNSNLTCGTNIWGRSK